MVPAMRPAGCELCSSLPVSSAQSSTHPGTHPLRPCKPTMLLTAFQLPSAVQAATSLAGGVPRVVVSRIPGRVVLSLP